MWTHWHRKATRFRADKAQMMDNISAHKTRVLSVTLEDLAARIYGDTAVLTGILASAS
jgi:hypothetical protein